MFRCSLGICLVLVVSLIAIGCGPSKSGDKSAEEIKKVGVKDHDHDSHQGGHTHYGAGPHGGSLIELGGDDYHAELVLDRGAHAIRIFLLKSDAKTPLVTKSAEATITLDKDQKLLLKATPLEGETEGQSSRFELVDDVFVHKLVDSGYLHGDLSIQIDEKLFQSHLDIHFEHGDSKPDHKHDDVHNSK